MISPLKNFANELHSGIGKKVISNDHEWSQDDHTSTNAQVHSAGILY